MNEWCLSCSCTFSTGCKKALRVARPRKPMTEDGRAKNIAKVAKWYAENKERRHAYLRERYKRMKGGEVRTYKRRER